MTPAPLLIIGAVLLGFGIDEGSCAFLLAGIALMVVALFLEVR